MSPEHAYPKSRFEPDSRSARLNAAPHRRAPALTPSPPTLNRWLGTRRLRPTALVHRGRRPSRKVERIRKSDSRLRALLRGGPVFDEITPECEHNHRAGARHPFQYYYRRFGVGSCVSSQTLLPGGLKPAGAAEGLGVGRIFSNFAPRRPETGRGRKRLPRRPSPGRGSGRSEAEVDGVVMQRPIPPPSDFAASSVSDSFSVPGAPTLRDALRQR